MRVLVTGANGFVGSALCPHLAALGHEVVPAVRRQSDIADEVIVHDAVSWKAALMGCDSVIHLAARAHVMQDQEQDSLQAFRANNVDDSIKRTNRAVEAGVCRFVFMSTIKVNGKKTVPGCSFSPDDPVFPKDPYAISKWEAEQGLFEIMKAHEEFIPWADLDAKRNALEMTLNVNDVGVIRLMMQQLVAGYPPSDDIVDWVYLEQESEAKAIT